MDQMEVEKNVAKKENIQTPYPIHLHKNNFWHHEAEEQEQDQTPF